MREWRGYFHEEYFTEQDMYTAYICMPAKYILSDNFTSEWHVPANSGLSRGPLSQPPFQWRSQRACHTGVSNAWKRQRVIDTPCPIARYTIGWCQLEVRAMTRSWNGAWFGQTGYIMYINIYKLKLRRACYHFLPWRAWAVKGLCWRYLPPSAQQCDILKQRMAMRYIELSDPSMEPRNNIM